MRHSILDLIDFTTVNADWKLPLSTDNICYFSITNRIKIRQKIIPVCGGNMVVTAGCVPNDGWEVWESLALSIVDGEHRINEVPSPSVCCVCEQYYVTEKKGPNCCTDCIKLIKSVSIPEYEAHCYKGLTILAINNHMMFCFKVFNGTYRVHTMCKSITMSKWKDIAIFNIAVNSRVCESMDPTHMDIVGVNNEHCLNKYSPCKCKKISEQIFAMNLEKYKLFRNVCKLNDLLLEITLCFITIN